MSPFVRYTVLRLLAFFVCLLVLSAIPWMRDNVIVLVLVAATASMLISLFFLNGPREELAARIADRVEHRVDAKQAQDQVRERRASGSRARRGASALTDEDAEDAEIVGRPEQYR